MWRLCAYLSSKSYSPIRTTALEFHASLKIRSLFLTETSIMCISPLSILINSCCCVLAVLLVTSTVREPTLLCKQWRKSSVTFCISSTPMWSNRMMPEVASPSQPTCWTRLTITVVLFAQRNFHVSVVHRPISKSYRLSSMAMQVSTTMRTTIPDGLNNVVSFSHVLVNAPFAIRLEQVASHVPIQCSMGKLDSMSMATLIVFSKIRFKPFPILETNEVSLCNYNRFYYNQFRDEKRKE